MSNYPTDELPLMLIFLNKAQTNAELWQLFLAPPSFIVLSVSHAKLLFFCILTPVQDDSS